VDELVFAEREVDIDTIPEGAAGFRRQHELVARQALLSRKIGLALRLGEFDHISQPPDEDLPAT
jgi:hypothetical protein